MGSVILLSLLLVSGFGLLCYLFTESRVELDTPTIAAMEAHAQAVESRRKAPSEEETEAPTTETDKHVASGVSETDEDATEAASFANVTGYEYRELLEEGAENYVLPQWMVNYFSSSDICHTLDTNDRVVFIVKLNDPDNAEGYIDVLADCDMSTQTIALTFGFGEGAAAESLKTKFYLFERGDLHELSRIARQDQMRIDVLTRAEDYTLEYAGTVRMRLPQSVVTQIKNVLAKIPT